MKFYEIPFFSAFDGDDGPDGGDKEKTINEPHAPGGLENDDEDTDEKTDDE